MLRRQGPWVYADEQRIGQVLHNLLDNALRHCQGGRRVDVAVQAAGGSATGSVTDCSAGGIAGQNCTTYGVTVTVTDDGEGILPGELEHVFDRFYRADRSRMRSSGGSGLGLAIARQLVLAHGGDMWVQSPPAGASAVRRLASGCRRPPRTVRPTQLPFGGCRS